MREVYEETGLTLVKYRLRAVITFISNKCEAEYMYLFTATEFTGNMIPCEEGDLKWIPKSELLELNLWEGDKIFLEKLSKDEEFFTLKVVYEGDCLVESKMISYQ